MVGMIELIEYIVKSLVDDEESVEITESVKGKTILFEIRVAQEDMGKIIGKQGKIAKALRTLTKAAATKENKKIKKEIID